MNRFNIENYRAIVSDLDGTIVSDSKGGISHAVMNAIKRWKLSDRNFTIATGRSYQLAQSICHNLELVDPIIVSGGAEIRDPVSGEILHSEYIPLNEVKEIIEILQNSEFLFEIQTDKVYASSDVLKIEQTHKKYEDLKNFESGNVTKIRMVTTKNDPNEVAEFVDREFKQFGNLHVIQANSTFALGIDITSIKATKHLAVLHLAEMLNIEPSQMIGIGDGMNDYPLLTACGYRVAMDGAPKELIEIADRVVPDYTKDGLAVFINDILV